MWRRVSLRPILSTPSKTSLNQSQKLEKINLKKFCAAKDLLRAADAQTVELSQQYLFRLYVFTNSRLYMFTDFSAFSVC